MYTYAVSFPWSACQRGRSCRQDRGWRTCTYVVACPLLGPHLGGLEPRRGGQPRRRAARRPPDL
eukprot:5926231-Pyramimonas_sp.AAC.1